MKEKLFSEFIIVGMPKSKTERQNNELSPGRTVPESLFMFPQEV
jgi:hypothetical protein